MDEIDTKKLPEIKISDYSLHQFPSVNMIKELKENFDVNLKVFVVQGEHVPVDISPGLSISVKNSVSKMCDIIIEEISRFDKGFVKQDKNIC